MARREKKKKLSKSSSIEKTVTKSFKNKKSLYSKIQFPINKPLFAKFLTIHKNLSSYIQ